jgi:hypothetical protein
MPCALGPMIGSATVKFRGFYPFSLGIQELNCCVNVAPAECCIRRAQFSYGGLSFLMY